MDWFRKGKRDTENIKWTSSQKVAKIDTTNKYGINKLFDKVRHDSEGTKDL